MVDDPKPPPPAPDPGGLQFDRAETIQPEGAASAGPSVTTCTGCGTALNQTFFLAAGSRYCPPCRETIQKKLAEGSRFGRFFRAAVFGVAAAFLGALGYYGFVMVFKWHLSLIAILVGWGVGVAVRNGSDRRGGWLYQALAMFLTYSAIVGMEIPEIAKGVRAAMDRQAAQAQPSGDPSTESTPAATTKDQAPTGGCVMGLVALVILSIAVLAIALVAPFAAAADNLLYFVIIGFALYEAWKINKRVVFEWKGPFQVEGASPEAKPGG